MENWVRIPYFIPLHKPVGGNGVDNLTFVIMEALMLIGKADAQNVKTRWVNLMEPLQRILAKYKPMLRKVLMDILVVPPIPRARVLYFSPPQFKFVVMWLFFANPNFVVCIFFFMLLLACLFRVHFASCMVWDVHGLLDTIVDPYC